VAQLTMKSQTKYFAEGSIIADCHEPATGLMVITSGFVNVELPMDSDEANIENSKPNGRTLLYVFGRGLEYLLCMIDRYDIFSELNVLHLYEIGVLSGTLWVVAQ
jgi:hypothetical protein